MRKGFLSFLILIGLFLVRVQPSFALQFKIPDQIIFIPPTSTPTPTPTVEIKIKVPVFEVKPFSTITPTLTVFPSATIEPTKEITPGPSTLPSIEPAEKQTEISPVSPTNEETQGAWGKIFPLDKIVLSLLVVILILVVVFQSQWFKIKKWLHKKTED